MMDEESRDHDQQHQPLLEGSKLKNSRTNFIQDAISQTFRSSAHLANLLPTGTVLGFQLLSPIFNNQGRCDFASQSMTAGLLILCGLLCFLSSFTDSFRDDKGTVHYGVVTFRGLWIIDGSVTIPHDQAPEFQLKVIDFFHAIMSALVFASVALFDENVVNCFYPAPSEETMELLTALPVGVGVFGSMCFIKFPTTRHGLGFPLSPR
ncbi:hypothetical protein NE237_000928 [Protea cynaroides]|uniref:Uncharacterized protein n=1 Tax=Protea cynaroides TaxID=273540 RepID=A0A9Q0QXX9_9MAGN|nr:hypothetical protein NE237_000928 [Protea cynaroides]